MRERMERANRAAAWERRSGRRLHKSARRASFPTASKPDRGQHHVAGSAAACAQAVQLLSGAPPCPYYGASDRTRYAPRAIARRWQAGRRRRGRGMDLQTAQPSLCAPPFPYCGAQGAMQALSRGKQSGASASPRDQRRSAEACAQAVQLLSGAPPRTRILVLRWSAQDAAAKPNEYALDCASDRKAYAWPPLPRTPHPRLTRWQRAFYHPFLWRTLCYGKRLCGQGNGKALALQRGRRERCQSGRAAHKGAARNHDGAQQKRLANAPA